MIINKVIAALSILCLLTTQVFANPMGGSVVTGSATISNNGNTLNIDQTSDKALIDWRSFNIQSHEATVFNQPSSSSLTVNRINDLNQSVIDGKLSANGNLVLINPNGILFGHSSKIDVSGIVASTSGINENSFLNGNLIFDKPGNPDSKIINHGNITARDAGLIGLVAPQVENYGFIKAKLGKITLASGDVYAIDLAGDGLINLEVTGNIKNQLVKNHGVIQASGGDIYLSAASARNALNSIVVNNGTVDASSYAKNENGGNINLLASNVVVLSESKIDASGDTKGGNIKIGGDYKGEGSTPTANKTIVEAGAEIKANAVNNGDGGRVIVWADDSTGFYGNIEAKGGKNSGDGGFVETSGKRFLDATGGVDTSAINGKTGTYLLDPTDITISTAADTGTMTWNGTNFSDTATASSNLNVTTLQNRLATNNVIITTASGLGGNGDISLNNDITWSSGNFLTLQADRDININSNINYTGAANTSLTMQANRSIYYNASADTTATGTGQLAITLNADRDANGLGAILLNTGSSLISNGGNIILGGGATPSSTAAFGIEGVNRGVGVGILHSNVNAGGGNITINGQGATFSTVSENRRYGVEIEGAGAIVETTGAGVININGTGGSATSDSLMVGIWLAGTARTQNGNLSLTGFGGNNDWGDNIGVYISGNANSTGSGNIIINGTGGDSPFSGNNHGVVFDSILSSTSTNTGNINIAGTSTGTNGTLNHGVMLRDGAVIGSSSTGNTTITGQTAGPNEGVDSFALAFVNANNTIGRVGSGGNVNLNTNSLSLGANSVIRSTGDVVIAPRTVGTSIGIAGSAGFLQINSTTLGFISANNLVIGRNDGTALIRFAGYDASARNWNLSILNGSGNIQFDGSVAASPSAFTMANNRSFSTASTSGNFNTSALGSVVTSGTGDITIDDNTNLGGNITFTSADTITLGGTVNGTHDLTIDGGTLNLSGSIGGVTPLSAVSITSANSFALPAITSSTIFARNTGVASDITLNGTLTASGAGNSIVLASGRNFINNVGAGVLNPGAGRWLVYSVDPAQNTLNGLVPTSVYSKTYLAYLPAAVTEPGNVMFYSVAAPPSGGGGSPPTPTPQPPVITPPPVVEIVTPPVATPQNPIMAVNELPSSVVNFNNTIEVDPETKPASDIIIKEDENSQKENSTSDIKTNNCINSSDKNISGCVEAHTNSQ